MNFIRGVCVCVGGGGGGGGGGGLGLVQALNFRKGFCEVMPSYAYIIELLEPWYPAWYPAWTKQS